MKKQCDKCVATLEKVLKEMENKDKYIAYLQRKLDETGSTYRKEFKENENET